MKKVLLVLALIVFSSPTYSSECSNEKILPEKIDVSKVDSFRVNDVNLRSGAGVKYCTVRVLSNVKNIPVVIIGVSNNWRYVVYEDKKYWVHKSMLNYKKVL